MRNRFSPLKYVILIIIGSLLAVDAWAEPGGQGVNFTGPNGGNGTNRGQADPYQQNANRDHARQIQNERRQNQAALREQERAFALKRNAANKQLQEIVKNRTKLDEIEKKLLTKAQSDVAGFPPEALEVMGNPELLGKDKEKKALIEALKKGGEKTISDLEDRRTPLEVVLKKVEQYKNKVAACTGRGPCEFYNTWKMATFNSVKTLKLLKAPNIYGGYADRRFDKGSEKFPDSVGGAVENDEQE